MEAVAAAGIAIALVVHNRHGQEAGYVNFRDGENHEIFAGRAPHLDRYLQRAFGYINEANDYGEISDLAA